MLNKLGRLYCNQQQYRSYVQAIKYYEQAVAQGSLDALNALGWMYANGEGVKLDLTQAQAYWKQAADKGNAEALINLRASGVAVVESPVAGEDSVSSMQEATAVLTQNIPETIFIDAAEIAYVKKDLLGRGGFGEVFKGTYKFAPVAIKTLILDKLDDRLLAGFQEEGKLMASLRHPNIIQFYGLTIQQPYHIVMEYMEQGSLYHVLHRSKELPWEQRIQWGVDIGTGLHYLHTLRPEILHRDLKSLNVLISKHHEAKLTDFGLALSNLRSTTKTMTSKKSSEKADKSEKAEVVGSLRWMAPELLSLKPKYSTASDVYAYAMVLWELASREIPYAQVADDRIITDGVRSGERGEIPEDCPKVLAILIQACWAQEPATRPSASDVVEQLSRPKDKLLGTTGIATQIAKSRGYVLDSERPEEASAASGYQFTSRP